MRVGIIGAGQLALYLCEAGRRLSLQTTVLSLKADSPAGFSADRVIEGDAGDAGAIRALLEDVDVVTFDIEDVPPTTLKMLAGASGRGVVAVHPHPSTMLVLQDKLLQRRWLIRNGLPTNIYRAMQPGQDPAEVAGWFGHPFVQKIRRGGYDGRGVQIVRSPAGGGALWDVASVIEPFLGEVRELAVLVARDTAGRVASYEPVELEFDPVQNVLKTAMAPARCPTRTLEIATAIARRAVGRLQGAGVFAVELFLTPDSTLLVNEISPRVHNSGHHTLESCETSQFEQHMRAITGMPLGSTRQRAPAVMHNLLGGSVLRHRTPLIRAGVEPTTVLHWYGKREKCARRKLGHITALGDSHERARASADRLLASLSPIESDTP